MQEWIYSIKEIQKVAKGLLIAFPELRIFAFQGDLGAGKTTLIQGLGQVLGCVDEISSPTFSLVNEYQNEQGVPIYHFDFYRIESEAEALDIGLYDYFDSGAYCFIEWPEKIPNLLPEEGVVTKIEPLENKRRLIAKAYGRAE